MVVKRHREIMDISHGALKLQRFTTLQSNFQHHRNTIQYHVAHWLIGGMIEGVPKQHERGIEHATFRTVGAWPNHHIKEAWNNE